MKIAFYFDPSCPFCWITSRWLLMVAAEREVTVDWRPFSLAIKNDELANNGHDKTEHGDIHRASHRILRVMQATAQQTDTSLIDLYSAFGRAFHLEERAFDNDLIAKVLASFNLPSELAAAADDTAYDDELRVSIKSATDVAGEDIGVPTIVFTAEDGSQIGFFGPVLQSLPDKQAGLKLWDGLSQLATDKNFYELKRTRPSGQPDVVSTKSVATNTRR